MPLDIADVKDADTEPMLLLDTTGSMRGGASASSSVKKYQVVGNALYDLIEVLGSKDSAGENEAGGGGVYTVTFAGGRADDFGDVNVPNQERGIKGNIQHFWDTRNWDGSTQIMPGYNAIQTHYTSEFLGKEVTPPKLLLVVITDGEATDEAMFERALAKNVENEFVVIAPIGHGSDYDAVVQQYTRLAEKYSNIGVVEMGGMSDGKAVAKRILDMIS